MKLLLIAVCFSLVVLTQGTQVRQCQGGKTKPLTSDEVKVSSCEKPPCRLKRKTRANIEMVFTPERDLKTLVTSVQANVAGIELPFIGVDGVSACDNLFAEDGKTKEKCPLKSGQKYVYKNSFPVLEVYPKLSLVVRWALTSKNKDIACFEIPARIL